MTLLVPGRKLSGRQRDRLLQRLEGAKVIVDVLAGTWWGRLALRLALRRMDKAIESVEGA